MAIAQSPTWTASELPIFAGARSRLPSTRITARSVGPSTPMTLADQPSSAPAGIPSHFNVTVPAGYLWVLGDHRGISDDSRGHEADPGDGMIPEDHVIGRAFLIAWPLSHWRVLSIPATFAQPGIVKSAAASAAYVPAAAGVTATFPVWWLSRRGRSLERARKRRR